MRSVRDVVTRFRENWRGYVHTYRMLLALTVLASLADMASTIYFMLIHGTDVEQHPAVRSFAYVLGPILGPIVGKAVQFFVVIALTVFLRRWALYIFLTVIILYLWAAWYNIWGYHLYYPRLLKLLEYLAI
ncbi:MAG: hypothetical protein JW955_08560 [Sedimentisphaerales bacterium]|nr:hypothetical protein [Sedimentisphaerales bacterium]